MADHASEGSDFSSARPLHVIVLAAGQGTRMHSDLPKVLHAVGGTPMLGHVLRAAIEAASGRVVVVVRYRSDLVSPCVTRFAPSASLVEQDDVPGTGRAVECALAALPDEGDVAVVSGDVPLLTAAELHRLAAVHRRHGALATILTSVVDDPTGYGRIVRDPVTDGVVAIVEEKDATPEQREIREINSGTYVFDVHALHEALGRVGVANAQGEKYLTDVIGLFSASDPAAVVALPVSDPWLVQGVNSPEQLAAVEGHWFHCSTSSR